MKIIGIICEYNPFHLGHRKQFDRIRTEFGPDCAIVCLMSGNFVQRGQPAIFDKSVRAKAALLSGADLVLEMPMGFALSSAEGFAGGGVGILGKFCHHLCFGAETGTEETLMATARALLTTEFSEQLREELRKGLSFPAARQRALEAMGLTGFALVNPNDILGVEYCKAILAQNSKMRPFVIQRQGQYHADVPDGENPSATSLRKRILAGGPWLEYVPVSARTAFEGAAVHGLCFGERAVLGRLRTMSDEEFEALPYGSEGLWRKLMHNCRCQGGLEDILTATKSKRYTRTRLDRMVMCAFLGLTQAQMEEAPYVRVLGFRERGHRVLRLARETGDFPHTGERTKHPYEALEMRWDDLYSLFCQDAPSAAGAAKSRRVCII